MCEWQVGKLQVCAFTPAIEGRPPPHPLTPALEKNHAPNRHHL